MQESLGSEGIWTHALGGGRCRDVEDTGVDGEWHPDIASGRCLVQSKPYHSERPLRLMHRMLRTHIKTFADVAVDVNKAVGCQPAAVVCQPGAVGCHPGAVGCQPEAVGC